MTSSIIQDVRSKGQDKNAETVLPYQSQILSLHKTGIGMVHAQEILSVGHDMLQTRAIGFCHGSCISKSDMFWPYERNLHDFGRFLIHVLGNAHSYHAQRLSWGQPRSVTHEWAFKACGRYLITIHGLGWRMLTVAVGKPTRMRSVNRALLVRD